jgi:hypothetical protein
MMNWLSIAVITTVLIGLGAGLFFAARSPSFVAGLAAIAIKLALPPILKAIAPKDLTSEQKDRIAEGKDPFNISKFDHEKWLQLEELKKKAGWKTNDNR